MDEAAGGDLDNRMDEDVHGIGEDENLLLSHHKLFDNASNGVKIMADGNNAIPIEQRLTTRYMTKYEKARLLGTRALQLR